LNTPSRQFGTLLIKPAEVATTVAALAAATTSSGERADSGWAIRSSTHWEKEKVVAEVAAGRAAVVAAIARASRGRETLTIVDCVGVSFAMVVGWFISCRIWCG